MSLHSSQLPRFAPLPKSSSGRSRADEKRERRAAEAASLKVCYAAVDARDGGRCRVCGRRCSPTALALLDRAERHHLVYRSAGGQHEPCNVLTLCATCHGESHTHGTLKLVGDADQRDERGRFNGVAVIRLVREVWVTERWI